ncbi:hypothetical protein [Alicyclobacillus sp.]|uniref:hypothetical protein n=1 Tax=Alicyclobacillus sp. TaxID=61169 RepID=UPI0025C69539|nr:hypothetical protein [Alicyclobacillus sp.]MCL6515516.1 hypothetical protein [Alicyclobacillus sp.]
MRSWKIILITGGLMVLLGAAALLIALWNNVDTVWQQETAAAQYALDHTPIDRIDGHDRFTANGVQEVFTGTDAFGRRWYVFVTVAADAGENAFTAQFVRADGLLGEQDIVQRAAKSHLRAISGHIGYVSPQSDTAFHSDSGVVWEVEALNAQGQRLYLYYDARTGGLLWTSGPLQGEDPAALWKEVLST